MIRGLIVFIIGFLLAFIWGYIYFAPPEPEPKRSSMLSTPEEVEELRDLVREQSEIEDHFREVTKTVKSIK